MTGVTAGSLTTVAANRSCTLNIYSELIETAGNSAKAREYMAGLYDWGLTSTSMLTAFASSRNHVSLTSKLMAGTKVRVAFQCLGDSNHIETYAGWALITNATLNGSVKNSATYDVALKGTGELEIIQSQPIVIQIARLKYRMYDQDDPIEDNTGASIILDNSGTAQAESFSFTRVETFGTRPPRRTYYTAFNVVLEITATVGGAAVDVDVLAIAARIVDTDTNEELYRGNAEQIIKEDKEEWSVDTAENFVYHNMSLEVTATYSVMGQQYQLTNTITLDASTTPT